MGIFSGIFGTESARFWRSRAERFEKKLDDERERHRIREEFLLDELLKKTGAAPIAARAEQKLDLNGFEADYMAGLKKRAERDAREREASEKQAFVDDCVRQGKSRAEAEQYFEENKAEILANQV